MLEFETIVIDFKHILVYNILSNLVMGELTHIPLDDLGKEGLL
jgi:hypothetical protein